jgi:hypothetical protein
LIRRISTNWESSTTLKSASWIFLQINGWFPVVEVSNNCDSSRRWRMNGELIFKAGWSSLWTWLLSELLSLSF